MYPDSGKMGISSVYSDILRSRPHCLDQNTRVLAQNTIPYRLGNKRDSTVPGIWDQESPVELPAWYSKSEGHSALKKRHLHSLPQLSLCCENSPTRSWHKYVGHISSGYLQTPGSKCTQGQETSTKLWPDPTLPSLAERGRWLLPHSYKTKDPSLLPLHHTHTSCTTDLSNVSRRSCKMYAGGHSPSLTSAYLLHLFLDSIKKVLDSQKSLLDHGMHLVH